MPRRRTLFRPWKNGGCSRFEPLGLTLYFCKDPGSADGYDYGAVVYNGPRTAEHLIVKGWGIRYYGGLDLDKRQLRVLLRLENGTDVVSPAGVRYDPPEDYPPNVEDPIGIVIRFRGPEGFVAERTIIFPEFTNQSQHRPPARGENVQAP